MKRIFALLIFALLIAMLPTVVFAEDSTVEIEPPVADTVTGEAPLPDDVTPDTGVGEVMTTAERLIEYIKSHFEELSVILTLIITAFYNIRKHGLLNKSIGTLNNNAVSVAENSNSAVQQALVGVSGISDVVKGFTDQIAAVLAEVRKNAEEKKSLEEALAEVQNHLKTAKLANVEFANELAELLVLANIPNAKKEELYSRHRAAVDAIAVAETEVTTNDTAEA